jgi:hypothetical protein
MGFKKKFNKEYVFLIFSELWFFLLFVFPEGLFCKKNLTSLYRKSIPNIFISYCLRCGVIYFLFKIILKNKSYRPLNKHYCHVSPDRHF